MNVNVSGGELSEFKLPDNTNVNMENSNVGTINVTGKFAFFINMFIFYWFNPNTIARLISTYSSGKEDIEQLMQCTTVLYSRLFATSFDSFTQSFARQKPT